MNIEDLKGSYTFWGFNVISTYKIKFNGFWRDPFEGAY